MTPNDESPLPRMFPVFLKLEGRPVLVVGAGPVAAEKIEALREAGARVTVVAPEATPGIRRAARAGSLAWKARSFRDSDVEAFRVVVASTGNPLVNRAVYRAASGRGVPVNVVDTPDLCDFYFGSVARRGPVTVAVSTAGSSPALARRVKQLLEQVLPRRLDRLARALAGTRASLLGTIPDYGERRNAVERLLDELPLRALDSKTDREISERVHEWMREVVR